MTITIITLIVLTLGNGYYLAKQNRRINKVDHIIKNHAGELLKLRVTQSLHTTQIDNHGAKIYDIELKWNKFNKTLNNTKLLKLSGFKKYSKKK